MNDPSLPHADIRCPGGGVLLPMLRGLDSGDLQPGPPPARAPGSPTSPPSAAFPPRPGVPGRRPVRVRGRGRGVSLTETMTTGAGSLGQPLTWAAPPSSTT
ncbi:hypothetical protein LT493_02570 [Streptomyces tricolor]|nr:hypothetical protein [Streptomyces tricolor]